MELAGNFIQVRSKVDRKSLPDREAMVGRGTSTAVGEAVGEAVGGATQAAN